MLKKDARRQCANCLKICARSAQKLLTKHTVGPRDRPRGALPALSGHGVLRSPGAGRSGPQGIGFPYSSVHARMNVGGVRMKLIFKATHFKSGLIVLI